MRYRNMELEAFDYSNAGGVERFRVRIAKSPLFEQQIDEAETVTVPTDLRKRLRKLERRALQRPDLIALGETLGGLLFPGPLQSMVARTLDHIAPDTGLRVQLKLGRYTLADLPWEYSYIPQPDTPIDQKGMEGFLALDRRISLVRYEVQARPLSRLDPVGAGSLRLVTLMADPNEPPDYPALKLADERGKIEIALQQLSPRLRAEFYPDATVERLQDALDREAHMFHFAGHGKFEGDLGMVYGRQSGSGFVVILNEQGRAMPFSVEKLALNLRGRGVRLAVLGACEAGRRDGLNAWTGIAPALTHAGIPAVVGMQYTIRDVNAIAFSYRFYRALAAAQSIDSAVTAGRLAIFNRSAEDERDWGVPVLYLRAEAEEGVLFPDQLPDQPAPNYQYSQMRHEPGIALIDSVGGAESFREALARPSSAELTCPTCGSTAHPGANFCHVCGTRVRR